MRLRVRNTGDVVDEYRFIPAGDIAPYLTVEPPTLRLYPGTTGTVELTVAPPRTPDAAAGPHPYAVQIIPTEHPEAATVPEGNITITPFTEMRAELVPHTVNGRFRGRPKLAIDNLGNTGLTASVVGNDSGDQLGYRIHPANVRIEPGRAAFVNTTLKPRRIIWIGPKQNHPYRLSVRRSGAGPAEVEGTYVQRGFLPRWLFTVLSLAFGLAVAFLALWFTNPPAFSTQATALTPSVSASELPTPLPVPAAPPPPPTQQATAPVAARTGGSAGGGSRAGSGGGGGGSGGGSGGGGVATAPAANGSGAVEIIGRGSNRCIDVTNGQAPGGKDGTPLEIWDCNGAAWQQWKFVLDNNGDYRGTIQSLGLCMDVAGANTADGTTVQLADCNGSPAQVWTLNTTTGGDLVSILDQTKCVQAVDAGTANGTRLQMFPCNGRPDQKWFTTPVS